MVAVLLEIEYDTDSLEEAKAFALADATRLFQQERVLAVSADAKVSRDLPITERYLEDQPAEGVVERVQGYTDLREPMA